MNTARFFRLLGLCLLLCTAPFTAVRGADLPDPGNFSRVVEMGDVRQVRAWLDAGLSADFEGRPIGTGLMIGAWTGNIAMMELFYQRGADINKTNSLGEQALLHAAWKGQTAALAWLLERGARPAREGMQWSALHYAAFAGHKDAARLLLARGADVNALSPNGSTPLMMAAREGQEAVAADLLQAGADPTVKNEAGENAEVWALRHNNTRIARLVAVSDPALRKPVTAGMARRSLPVNDIADRLLVRARELEALGRREDALKTFRAAMTAIKRFEQDQQRQQARKAQDELRRPGALRITARRDSPTEQSANLSYVRPASSGTVLENPGIALPANAAPPKVGAGGTAPAAGATAGVAANAPARTINSNENGLPQDPVDRLLAEARQLDAQGRRKEALARYRQASELLRRF